MEQITHPLCDRDMIIARQEAVSEIAASMASSKVSQNIIELDEADSDVMVIEPELNYVLSSVLTTLGRTPDIQRGITRIFHRTATPSEVPRVTFIFVVLEVGCISFKTTNIFLNFFCNCSHILPSL